MSIKDFCLHPEFVEDVVKDLLSCDIICKEKMELLKSDRVSGIDHNLIMDVRHKEVKKKSLIDFVGREENKSNGLKRQSRDNCKEKPFPVKDLKTIDKEIANARKTLETFQNKLEKKNKLFINSITNLESLEKQEKIKSQAIVNLNEEEEIHNFNLHLNKVEESVSKNLHNEERLWKPVEVGSSPVLNIISNIEDDLFDIEEPSKEINFEQEELEILAMCQMSSIHVKGTTILNSSTEFEQIKEVRNIVPNNTPSLYPDDFNIANNEENKMTKEEIVLYKKVIEKWRLFVEKAKEKQCEEKRIEKLKLLQRAFTSWLVYVKWQKAKKRANLSYAEKTKKHTPGEKRSYPVFKKDKEQTTRKFLELQKKNLDYCIDSLSQDTCPKNLRTEKILIADNSLQNFAKKNPTQSQNFENSKINFKVLIPEEFGLNSSDISHLEKPEKSASIEAKIVSDDEKLKKIPLTSKTEKIKKHSEPFSNRYAAKEKIIAQQMEVIEKQKQIIFDLQAQNLEAHSKLSLQKVENELAKVSTDKKLKLIDRKTDKVGKKLMEKNESNIKLLDEKSEQLMKKMIERQEYCKQLAEKTRLRKIRMEEEKAQKQLEMEEKEKKKKEEEKRQRILKIKMEQQIAKEKAEKFFAEKWLLARLATKATKHYENNLMKKAFMALKKASTNTRLKCDELKNTYERKLLQNIFTFWRDEAKHRIALKNEMAEKFYNTKLIEKSWNIWRRRYQEYKIKVQVSDDMFALKLQERMLRRWMAFAAKQYLQNCCRIEMADRLYRKQLLRRVFRCWREFPRLMFAEREKEQRRRAWRQTVQELIPDFSPVFADDFEV